MLQLDVTPDFITNEANNAITKSKKLLQRIINLDIKSIRDCDIFIALITEEFNSLSNAHSYLGFFQYYSKNKNVIKASIDADTLLSNYSLQFYQNEVVYQKIVDFFNKITENKKIVPDYQDIKLITILINTFKLYGIDKNKNEKAVLDKINKYINDIQKKLISVPDVVLTLSNSDVIGVPSSILNTFAKTGDKIVINLTKHNYQLCMKFIQNENIRQKIEYEYSNRFSENIADVMNIIMLRSKKAKLLNYESHFDLTLEKNNCTFRNAGEVNDYLNDIMQKVDYRYYKEISSLLKLKNTSGSAIFNNLNSWDIAYYTLKWKQSYGINDNAIREYFEYNNTLKTIIAIYSRIFQVTIMKKDEYYEVVSDKVIGYFLVDLRNANNVSNNLKTYCVKQPCGKNVPVVALLGYKDNLLYYQDVIEIFHEFAHVFHNIFGMAKYSTICGSNVEDDFIEIPAYYMEGCCVEYFLKEISCHHKTGEKLDDGIIDKIKKIKYIDVGINFKKNILLSQYDILLHSSDKFINTCESLIKDKRDPKLFFSDVFKKLADVIMKYEGHNDSKYKLLFNNNLTFPSELLDILCFSDASYYSNLTNKIIACEYLWYKRHDNNKFILFRDKILKCGGTKSATTMTEDFIGGKLSLDGFMNVFKMDTNDTNCLSVFLNSEKINKNYADTNHDVVHNKYREVRESELYKYVD